MTKIDSKLTRKLLSSILKDLNIAYKKRLDHKLKLSHIDALVKLINDSSMGAIKTNKTHLKNSLSLANLQICCVGLTALSFNINEIIPSKWLNQDETPNPNHILQCMLVQVANYSLSVTLLLERGLDNPARALCRTIQELTELILVLIQDKEKFTIYASFDEENEKRLWNRHFSHKKLNSRLSEIENSLGLPVDIAKSLSDNRANNYKYYSQAIHVSYVANVIGAYATTQDNDLLSLAICGGENLITKQTMNNLTFTLWYFIICFYSVLVRQFNFKPELSDEDFWPEAFALHFCTNNLYLFFNMNTENS